MTRWSTLLPASTSKPRLVLELARALANGEASQDAIVSRAADLLGREWRWIRPVAQRYLREFSASVRPRLREVSAFLLADPGFRRAWKRGILRLAHLVHAPAIMLPAPAAASWGVPDIPAVGALAQWLRLSPSELEWLADLKGILARSTDPRLRHYSYRLLPKTSGGVRLIEAPKQHMRAMQRQILREILARIPVHPSAHGFVKGRSIRTFAAPHTGRAVVLRIDLKDFFPTLRRARVQALLRMCGYPETVADRLGGICTSITPPPVFSHLPWSDASAAREFYGRPHLPQGAPTSPALANACAYRMDCRLDGLARAAGVVYTRYADDLAFSGGHEFAHRAERFAASAAAIAIDEGFAVHFRKTRIMRQGVRQHLAGLVTNAHLNVPRRDYDLIKATLTNCIRHGPATQNRDGHADFRAHLHGRVSFVESINPARGERLRRLFERIKWPADG